MADADVSAVDKVGIPGPDVFGPPVKASSQDGQPFLAVCPPGPGAATEREQGGFAEKPVDKPESLPDDKKPNGISRGHSGHGLGAPEPVEEMYVPQTPLDSSAPAGGTPRPELETAQDPAPTADEPSSEPAIEPVVMTGVQDSTPAAPETSAPKENNDGPKPLPLTESHKSPTPSAPESSPSKSKEPTISKAAESAAKAPIVNGTMNAGTSAAEPEVPATHAATGPASGASVAPPPASISETSTTGESESRNADFSTKPPGSPGTIDPAAGEKRKLDEVAVPETPGPLAEDDASAAPGAPPLHKKPKIDETASKASKPKKEKKLPAVGRAARKTRSQGPVDV
ncbi:hypothetical protein EsDP_00000747 [Epichloe bromicola]|uniref:Uncharacterized protein n=1 Tax=Epichloe bromicola TaxID=79588 RepID=A0ABQ0CFT8_9HYPO